MGLHTILEAPAQQAGPTRQVLDSLRRLVQALRESTGRAQTRTGLTGAQLFALQQFEGGAALSVNALAALTFTHQSSVSVVAQRLVDRGLLRRRQSAEDRRRVELTATPRGRALLRKAPEVAQAGLAAAVERLAPKEQRALARGLAALEAQMGLGEHAPEMFFEGGRP
jgi:DNA-binding MarR family transcriptional regulator